MPAIPEPNANTDAFREALRDLGHINGQNIDIASRWGCQFREDASELVRLKVASKEILDLAAGHRIAAVSYDPAVAAAAADQVIE
jgi:hypothetical protein